MSAPAAAPTPLPAAPQARTGYGSRAYLLAGCSVGGTLCASLAANSSINIVFALASAVFGGMIVLLTAAPMVAPSFTNAAKAGVAAAAAAHAAPAGDDGIAPPMGAPAAIPVMPVRPSSIAIGATAAILSFIMNQIAQVAFGFVTFNVVTELTAEELMLVSALIGIGVLIVKTPFDLFVGAFHTSRARNIPAALGIFVLTYLFCYFIEQMISAAMGASGLFTTVTAYGLEGLMWGMLYVLGIPLVAQAVGAFGVRLAAMLPRRASS